MKVRSNENPIIMLDDEQEDLFTFQKAYKRFGLKNPLIQFQNPNSFFQYLEMVKQGINLMPELIVIDINIGRLNGFDIVKEIRSDKFFVKVPTIMMLTNQQRIDHKEQTKKAGADSFAVKPVGLKEYQSLMESIYWV